MAKTPHARSPHPHIFARNARNPGLQTGVARPGSAERGRTVRSPRLMPSIGARLCPGPPTEGGVRWILSTNVAETSLTIPGGVLRHRQWTGSIVSITPRPGKSAQILEVVRISQFSARQRAGRAGRTGPGTCLRLYSEADFHHGRKPKSPIFYVTSWLS